MLVASLESQNFLNFHLMARNHLHKLLDDCEKSIVRIIYEIFVQPEGSAQEWFQCTCWEQPADVERFLPFVLFESYR